MSRMDGKKTHTHTVLLYCISPGAGSDEDLWDNHLVALCVNTLASRPRAAGSCPRMDGVLEEELHVSRQTALSSRELRPGTAVLAGTQPPQAKVEWRRWVMWMIKKIRAARKGLPARNADVYFYWETLDQEVIFSYLSECREPFVEENGKLYSE